MDLSFPRRHRPSYFACGLFCYYFFLCLRNSSRAQRCPGRNQGNCRRLVTRNIRVAYRRAEQLRSRKNKHHKIPGSIRCRSEGRCAKQSPYVEKLLCRLRYCHCLCYCYPAAVVHRWIFHVFPHSAQLSRPGIHRAH